MKIKDLKHIEQVLKHYLNLASEPISVDGHFINLDMAPIEDALTLIRQERTQKKEEMDCPNCEKRGYEYAICGVCKGSGEGPHEGMTCRSCHGTGMGKEICRVCGGEETLSVSTLSIAKGKDGQYYQLDGETLYIEGLVD